MSIKGTTFYVPIATQGRDNVASQKVETGCLGHRDRLLKKGEILGRREHGNNLLRYPFPPRLTSPGQIECTLTRWMNTFHLIRPNDSVILSRRSIKNSRFNKQFVELNFRCELKKSALSHLSILSSCIFQEITLGIKRSIQYVSNVIRNYDAYGSNLHGI